MFRLMALGLALAAEAAGALSRLGEKDARSEETHDDRVREGTTMSYDKSENVERALVERIHNSLIDEWLKDTKKLPDAPTHEQVKKAARHIEAEMRACSGEEIDPLVERHMKKQGGGGGK